MTEIQLLRLGPGGQESEPIRIRRFPCLLGRHADCDVRLGGSLVSRRHCGFFLREGRVWVEDLGSLNGTHLNRVPVEEARPLHGGDQLGVGVLTFRVCLIGGAPETDTPTVPEGGAGRQVLVVEDDVSTAQALAVLLESWGHHVKVVHDGPQAIRAARAALPEVVFLDIGLPSMSGVEVARRLRADPALRDTRLVAVTGDEGATEVLHSRASFEQLLVKPVPPHVLREAVGEG
jgi:CheY-like chemotaxis protein